MADAEREGEDIVFGLELRGGGTVFLAIIAIGFRPRSSSLIALGLCAASIAGGFVGRQLGFGRVQDIQPARIDFCTACADAPVVPRSDLVGELSRFVPSYPNGSSIYHRWTNDYIEVLAWERGTSSFSDVFPSPNEREWQTGAFVIAQFSTANGNRQWVLALLGTSAANGDDKLRVVYDRSTLHDVENDVAGILSPGYQVRVFDRRPTSHDAIESMKSWNYCPMIGELKPVKSVFPGLHTRRVAAGALNHAAWTRAFGTSMPSIELGMNESTDEDEG